VQATAVLVFVSQPDKDRRCFRFGCRFRTTSQGHCAPMENDTRYSPAKCIGCSTKDVSGNPDPKHVSTSFVERQNWTLRTTLRRYTRLSNGFSRKAGESCRCRCSELFRVQLHQDSSYTARVSSNGSRYHGSAVERGRFGNPLGRCRAAEGGKSGMMQIPVFMRGPIATFMISIGGTVAGVLIAWKLLKPKSK
jgi:hypothetical protein